MSARREYAMTTGRDSESARFAVEPGTWGEQAGSREDSGLGGTQEVAGRRSVSSLFC